MTDVRRDWDKPGYDNAADQKGTTVKLSNLDRINELRARLVTANNTLDKFKRVKTDLVPCVAYSDAGAFCRGADVELLPVPLSVAISAAERDVSKIVAELQQLGVTL